jgi:uncharacterized protein (DUF697 family)
MRNKPRAVAGVVMAAATKSNRDPHEIALHCRALLKRRALTAAAAVVPIPGLGFALDVVLLTSLLDAINAEFGLTAAELEALPSGKRQHAFNLIQLSGNYVIGKVVTTAVIVKLLAAVGVRVGTKRVAKYVPLVGQAASAALGFAITKKLGEKHIEDCLKLRMQLALPAPRVTAV